jgi:hypothetical protein
MKDKRYELKFVLDQTEYQESRVFLLQKYFKKRYKNRTVNSLYFETLDFKSVRDNLTGISKRKKIRLRWYDKGDSPQIEIKQRSNRLGSKNRISLDDISPIEIYQNSISQLSKKIFISLKDKNQVIPNNYFLPQLYVNYEREYFENRNNIRITIDRKINFSNVMKYKCLNDLKRINYNKIILELKFDPNRKNYVSNLIKNLKLTPCRHSKYLAGMSKIGYATYI